VRFSPRTKWVSKALYAPIDDLPNVVALIVDPFPRCADPHSKLWIARGVILFKRVPNDWIQWLILLVPYQIRSVPAVASTSPLWVSRQNGRWKKCDFEVNMVIVVVSLVSPYLSSVSRGAAPLA